VKGTIHIDAGAAGALVGKGRSLLPAGIVRVEGRFERGDTVGVCGPDGDEIARGLAGLSSEECAQIAGRKLDAAARQLGYALPKAAIHRDDMLLLVR
jgi:glutamate 5-kinase